MQLPRLSTRVAIGIVHLAAAAVLLTCPCAAQSLFSVTGPGGAVPASGTGGGGTWPNQLPTAPFVSTATNDVPVQACRFTRVTVWLVHSFIGDLQIVLISPRGQKYNIVHRPGFTGAGYGSDGNANATYYIEHLGTHGFDDIPSTGDWGGGPYSQNYGEGAGMWPSGAGGVVNVDIDEIPAEPGTWQLAIYDWASMDSGQCVSWELRGLTGLSFFATGPGGAIPAIGTGGAGTWPSALPPYPFLESTMPQVGTCKIESVHISGLNHAYVGDLHFALWISPSYAINLVHRPGFTGTGYGNSGDCIGGNYDISSLYDTSASLVPASGNWLPGTYRQYDAAWPSGNLAIVDQGLWDVVPPFSPWTLAIYDWAGGDSGSCTSWGVFAHFLPPEPRTYCSTSTTTSGCRPWITATATPSVSYANPCFVTVSDVEGQKNGLIFYGVSGRIASPWAAGSSSTLCVDAPTQRTHVQSTGGTAGQCNGSLFLDWNQYRSTHPTALGQPVSLGDKVWLQAWFRDPPAPKTTNLSNALELIHVP